MRSQWRNLTVFSDGIWMEAGEGKQIEGKYPYKGVAP